MPTLTLTPALADKIADAVSRGVPVETAAMAAGVSKSAAYQWLQAAELGHWPQLPQSPVSKSSAVVLAHFAERIRVAQAQWEAKQIAGIAEASEQYNAKSGVREWRAGAWLLNNHPATRERYREHRQTVVEQTGTVHHAHQVVRALPDSELLALADGGTSVQPSELEQPSENT